MQSRWMLLLCCWLGRHVLSCCYSGTCSSAVTGIRARHSIFFYPFYLFLSLIHSFVPSRYRPERLIVCGWYITGMQSIYTNYICVDGHWRRKDCNVFLFSNSVFGKSDELVCFNVSVSRWRVESIGVGLRRRLVECDGDLSNSRHPCKLVGLSVVWM